MALNSLSFPASVTTSSAASLKSPVLTVLAKCRGFLNLFRSFLSVHPQPISTPSNAPVSTDPLSSVWFPQSPLGSWFCLAPYLWTSVPSRQHKWGLLHTGCWADFCKQPLVHTQCLSSQHLEVILDTQKGKLLLRVILRRDPWLSKLPPSHGSGITAYDESSLLTVHRKTFSEILCPKLCIWLFGLFGDLQQWEI